MKKEIPLKIIKAFLVLLEALLLGGAVTFAVEWITKGNPQAALDWCLGAGWAFCLSALLYGAVALFLGLLSNYLFLGALVVSTFGVLLALVNYFKSAINGTPLEVEDFGMIRQLDQVINVAGDLTVPSFAWSAALMLALCALFLFLLRRKLPMGNLRTRFVLLSIELALMLSFGVGAGAVLLGQIFSVDMETRIASRISYRDYGLTVGLWRDCFLLANREPEGYSAAYMDAVVTELDGLLQPLQTKNPEPPNVIFVLSESFYDLKRLPELQFSADPLENYRRLQQEGISGKFYTSYLGYGTGYIEMSIFSGIAGKDMKPGTNLCFRNAEDYSLLDSLVTPFQSAGFETEMLHAYNNTLYNRMLTYPRMGFNQLLFSPEMQALELNVQGSPYAGGYYLSDHVFTQALLNRLDAANAEGKRAFLFGISMENHQPFDPEKFGYKNQIDVNSDALSEEDLAITRVMVEGITRADQALGELTEALRQRETPTLLVFFGDHRPNLFMTDGDTVYSHLDLCKGNDCSDWSVEQVADLYSTDYLIWANDAALLEGKSGVKQDTGLTAIGPTLLELAGMPMTRYWAMQERLSQALLVDTDLYCVTGDGAPYWNSGAADLTQEDRTLMDLRDAIVYDAFYGQRYVTQKMNQAVGSE